MTIAPLDLVAPPPDHPSLRDQAGELFALFGVVLVAGPPAVVAAAATVLLALMLAGPFALIATFVAVALTAAAILAAILALPFLLVRRLRAR